MPRRQSKQPEERRLELETSAAELFSEKGYEHTSVSDIVKAVGVAQGTFYYHFKSKEEVLEAVVDRVTGGLGAQIDAAVQELDADAVARLDRVLELLMSAMLDNQGLIAFLQHPGNVMLHERMRHKLVCRIQPALDRLVRGGVKQGDFTVPHPAEASEVLLSTVAHLARLGVARRKRPALGRLKKTVTLLAHRMLGVEASTP